VAAVAPGSRRSRKGNGRQLHGKSVAGAWAKHGKCGHRPSYRIIKRVKSPRLAPRRKWRKKMFKACFQCLFQCHSATKCPRQSSIQGNVVDFNHIPTINHAQF
jgi:hypothetical protein